MNKKLIFIFSLLTLFSFNSLAGEINIIDNSQKISADFFEADIKDVLAVLISSTQYNLVLSDGISGKVSIKFKQVPVFNAIDAIIKVSGFTYHIEKDILRVTTVANLENRKKTEKLLQHEEELIPLVFNLKYINAKSIKNIIDSQLTEKGTVEFLEEYNNETLTMVVTDTALTLEKIKVIIDQLDVLPKQILLKTQAIEFTGTIEEIDKLNTTIGNIFKKEKGNGTTLKSSIISGEDLTSIINSLNINQENNVLLNTAVRALNNYETDVSFAQYINQKNQLLPTSVNLKILPYILKDNMIRLNIHPILTTETKNTPPKLNLQEIQTQALLKSGETIVLGGFEEVTITPKTIFKAGSATKTRLLVFITPYILE